jgi:hypothetical protein
MLFALFVLASTAAGRTLVFEVAAYVILASFGARAHGHGRRPLDRASARPLAQGAHADRTDDNAARPLVRGARRGVSRPRRSGSG